MTSYVISTPVDLRVLLASGVNGGSLTITSTGGIYAQAGPTGADGIDAEAVVTNAGLMNYGNIVAAATVAMVTAESSV